MKTPPVLTFVVTYIPQFAYPWRIIIGNSVRTFALPTDAANYIAEMMQAATRLQDRP